MIRLPVVAFFNSLVYEALRQQLKVPGQFGKRFPGPSHRGKNLERAHNAVARSLSVERKNVAGGFAAEAPAALQKLLKNVAVAHEFKAEFLHALFKTIVRHEGAHDAEDFSPAHAVPHENVKELISVVNIPFSVRHDQPVGIAVETYCNLTRGFLTPNG